MVAAVDGDPGHPKRLPQRQESGAFYQAASPGVRRGAGSGVAQGTLRLHLPLPVRASGAGAALLVAQGLDARSDRRSRQGF